MGTSVGFYNIKILNIIPTIDEIVGDNSYVSKTRQLVLKRMILFFDMK